MSFLIIVVAILCLLLIMIVLVQNPKGGGLSSGFSSANQIGGVRRTGDFLEKATWTLAIAVMAMSVLIVVFSEKDTTAGTTTSTGDVAAEYERRQQAQINSQAPGQAVGAGNEIFTTPEEGPAAGDAGNTGADGGGDDPN